MSARSIRIIGDPVLHRAAQPVSCFNSKINEIVCELFETMRAAPGVGLAAPQIGIPLQVFVWEWTDSIGRCWSGSIVNPTLQINAIGRNFNSSNKDFGGCLSAPDLRFTLRRSEQVVLSGVSAQGDPLRITAQGWLARIFQHEYDHLQGIIYLDRLRLRERLSAKKIVRARGWGKPENSWVPGVDPYELGK